MLSALLALAIAAPPTARYTTLFSETIDSKVSPRSLAEVAFIAKLQAAGFRVTDEEQSRKIRSVTDAGRLIDGTIPDVITTRDADVILVALVKLARTESEMLGKDAARYSASIEARAIAVDTGEILGAFTSRGTGLNFAADRAAQNAAVQAAEDLAAQIIAKLPKTIAPQLIALSISGIPDVAAGKAIREAIAKIDGVERVDVEHSGRGATDLSITASGMNAESLALALEDAGAGLTVFGHAKRSIKAEYSTARALRLQLAAASFEGGPLGAALAEIAATALANSPLLSVRAEIDPIALPRSMQDALTKHGYDPDRTVVLLGKYSRRSGKAEISARLIAAGGSRVLASATASCTESALSSCSADVGRQLLEKLPAALAEKRTFAPVAEKPLAVLGTTAADLFPARTPEYATKGLGAIEVENRGAQPIEALVISAEIPGLTTAPIEQRLEKIAPKTKASIRLPVVIEKKAFAAQGETRPVAMTVSLEYQYDGYRVAQRHSRALMVFPRNAMSWADEETIASFVTNGDPAVAQLAKGALQAVPAEKLGDPIALPAALFAAMSHLTYARDPEHPYSGKAIDHVLFPREMLAQRSGDCDDLSVLYAALAEAAGLRALLLTTPGHIFAAVDAGMPERNRRLIAVDPEATFVHEGHTFIPVETTRAGKSFREAWRAAVAELAKVKHRPGVIDLRRAWIDHPPIDLAVADRAAPIAELEAKVKLAVAAEERARESELEEALKRAKSVDERALLLAIAERLQEAGRAYAEGIEKRKTAHRINNLGNVRLIEGDANAALDHYQRALEELDQVPIHINAALAAWLLGDEERFTDHIASCLDRGGERAVAELADSDLGGLGSMRGADQGGLAKRDLQEAVRDAYRRAKKAPPPMAKTRARQSDERRGIVRRYLYWL